MINKLLKNSAIVLTIVTAFLYLVGISFNQGYLAEFGVTAKVFPLHFNEAILKGFITIVGILGNYIWYSIYVLIAIFLINLAIVLINEFLLNSGVNDEERVNTSSNLKADNKIQNGFLIGIVNFLKLVGNRIYDLLLLFIVLTSILAGTAYLSNSFGTEKAQKFKEDFKKQLLDGENQGLKLIELSWDDSKTRGAVISYSDNFVLIYTEDFETLIFNNSKFDYIRLANK